MASLPLGLQVLERAHVVQAVGQLDEDHAHVADHGQQHLADVFGLAVFAVGELDLVDLGDALDDVRHLVAKAGLDLLAGGWGVFDGIVQQAGGDGGGVQLHLGENFGDFKRVDDVGLAGGARLALVVLDAKLPCLANKSNVFSGSVALDVAKELIESAIDGCLVEDRASASGGRRGFPGGAGESCRCGLPDCRHTSL